jgi:hypothetical protein
MSEPRPEPDAGPDHDVWDSPEQREYEADPAAYEARVEAEYAERQTAEAAATRAQIHRDAEVEAEFWEKVEAADEADAEGEAEAGAEIG